MELNAGIPFHAVDVEVLLRLTVAAVLGLLLGLDREMHGNPAGLRTHGLICFTASAMTVSMIGLYSQFEGQGMDPLRIYEATGAFIGIIGAGLIVFSKGQVKNLTTAAHLWLAAVAGVACGAGQWPLVAMTAVVSLVMLTLLGLAEKRLRLGDDRHANPPRQEDV